MPACNPAILPRARDLYQKLATLEPQNPLHMQNYQQVVSQLGGTSGNKLITPEEAAVLVDDLEATAPSVHQHYSDEIALAVRSALTDAELFISYNMPAKALGPLVAACRWLLTIFASISVWPRCIRAPHASPKRRSAAALCKVFIPKRTIRKKLPDTANWPSVMKNALRLPRPAASAEDAPIFLDAAATVRAAEASTSRS